MWKKHSINIGILSLSLVLFFAFITPLISKAQIDDLEIITDLPEEVRSIIATSTISVERAYEIVREERKTEEIRKLLYSIDKRLELISEELKRK